MAFRVEHPDYGRAWLYFEHQRPAMIEQDGQKFYFHGATAAVLENDFGEEIAYAEARVHHQDQFNKETGRRQALKKLQKRLRSMGYPGSYLGILWHTYIGRKQ